jgi:hypothetical protein
MDVPITVTVDYNSSNIELLFDNESLTVVWILDWTNFMQTKYRTPSQTVHSSIILCCHETCDSPWAIHWFIQAYLLLWKHVSASHCLATDVSAVLLWLHTSGFQVSCHNIYVIIQDMPNHPVTLVITLNFILKNICFWNSFINALQSLPVPIQVRLWSFKTNTFIID